MSESDRWLPWIAGVALLLLGAAASLSVASAAVKPAGVAFDVGPLRPDTLVDAMRARPRPPMSKADARRFRKVLRAVARGKSAPVVAAWDRFGRAYFNKKTLKHARALHLIVLQAAMERHAPHLARTARLAARYQAQLERLVARKAELERAQAQASTSQNSVGVGTAAPNAIAPAASGSSSTSELMAAEREMQEMNRSFNLQYLQLQQDMQSQNREFTTISNVMKTKHDTAKNAINNVR